ncbi:MAG: type II toxin-antitoxin system VapC family toxin [Ferruginibacter sp.]
MSGAKFLLDANSVFYLLQGKLSHFKNNLSLDEIAISIITRMEFLSNNDLGEKDKYLFENFLKGITVFYIAPPDEKLIKETVRIRKKYKLTLPDAIIASTALLNDLILISADAVFSKIFNLKFQLIKT